MRTRSRYRIRFHGFSFWFYGTLARSYGTIYHFNDVRRYNPNTDGYTTLGRVLIVQDDDAEICMTSIPTYQRA